MYAYDIFRPGKAQPFDTVFASYKDADEMRRSLIAHDNYPLDIIVRLRANGRYAQTATRT